MCSIQESKIRINIHMRNVGPRGVPRSPRSVSSKRPPTGRTMKKPPPPCLTSAVLGTPSFRGRTLRRQQNPTSLHLAACSQTHRSAVRPPRRTLRNLRFPLEEVRGRAWGILWGCLGNPPANAQSLGRKQSNRPGVAPPKVRRVLD